MGNTPATPIPADAPSGVSALAALMSIASPPAGAAPSDPLQDAALYLTTAQNLVNAAINPAALSSAQLAVDLRLLRQAAKIEYARLANTATPPDPAIAALVDNAFTSMVFSPALAPAATAATAATADRLTQMFLAVPAGGFNAAADYIRGRQTAA